MKKKGGTKRAAPASLPALAQELVAQPRSKANNLPRLLAALKPGCAEVRRLGAQELGSAAAAAAAAASAWLLPRSPALPPARPPQATPVLHHLRIFFIDSFDRGDLAVVPPPEEDQSAEAVYSAWLHRQYCAYTAALLRLLGAPGAEPRTQVGGFGGGGMEVRPVGLGLQAQPRAQPHLPAHVRS